MHKKMGYVIILTLACVLGTTAFAGSWVVPGENLSTSVENHYHSDIPVKLKDDLAASNPSSLTHIGSTTPDSDIYDVSFANGITTVFSRPEVYLDLGDRVVSMEELTLLLDSNPSLRKVDMFGTVVEKDQIEYLIDRYPNIEFGWTIHIPGRFEGHTIRTDQTAFSTLHGNCITHTSEDFSVLRYCKELRALDLGHNVIDDLSFLSGLTKMRILILACNKITDLSPLAGMRDLEYVELFSNPISDLSPLYDLPHLKDLNVAYLDLEDPDTLFHFHTVQRMWISRCMKGKRQLKKESFKALREAYPNAVICNDGEPTEGGWRRHPRYDIMKECFLTGVYRPFDEQENPQ